MSQWRQPWNAVELAGRPCRVQVLDPEATFELEPEIVRAFGETLSLALASPEHVLSSVWSVAHEGHSQGMLAELGRPGGAAAAANGLRLLARLLARAIKDANIDPAWLAGVFRRLLVGRLEVGGVTVTSLEALPFGPLDRWRALAFQLGQTFGPLWLRSPYSVRSSGADLGTPEPKSVSTAVRWCSELARQGYASSPREMLSEWTPVQVIEVVESAAYAAERERRAYNRARSGE